MNHELPKPLRDALARQVADDVHPSADALTAFAENSLPPSESQRVTAHLAQCTDCREVVFLASSAVEEPVSEEQELAAATAARPLAPAWATVKAPQATVAAPSGAAPRRSRWRLWWVWAPAVAAVLVAAGVVIEQRSEFSRSAPMTMAVKAPPPVATTSEQPPAAAPSPESAMQYAVEAKKTTSAPPKPLAKPARTQIDQNRSAESLTASSTALHAREEPLSAAAGVAGPPPPAMPLPLGVLNEAAKVPAAAPTQNSFVESEGQGTNGLLAGARPIPQIAMRSVSGPRSQWRISSDGHLERSTAPGTWTPVLTEQPTTFHVVSVVGNNVWAGGSGGALFHSSDGGQNWSKQPLAAEAGTIVSIRFSDAVHGIVNTDAGARWSTSDGGVTWTKE
jgi:Photosynthesis system II assembly factor YCF48/Putative zinc-finger